MDLSPVKAALQNGANHFKAFRDAQEGIDALQAMQGYEGELKASVAALEGKRATLQDAQVEHDKIIESAKAKASEITAAASKSAKQILSETDQRAQKIIDGATDKAKKIEDTIGGLVAEAEDADAQAKAAKARLAEVQAQLDSLEALKEAARKTLGA